ncbi:hypothetical protein FHS96_005443 [Sphingomonas zeicaulis]|uniref:hypothetical protein n=1 Tax=Sphingomonas zeicaulis TaxID=1632740 RepID=UPI003D1BEDBF
MIEMLHRQAVQHNDLVDALTASTISAEAYRRWSDAEGTLSPQATDALQALVDNARRLLDTAQHMLKLREASMAARSAERA